MVTKLVGVRELKNQAPKLVQRAERGEEFVVTRHGKAVAVLGPATPGGVVTAGRPRFDAWNGERRAFERSRPKLERVYKGKFVAVSGGKVIDADVDASALFTRAARSLDARAFFIGRVGEAEPVVDMPGFELL
jgi:prevent-host-death family protein